MILGIYINQKSIKKNGNDSELYIDGFKDIDSIGIIYNIEDASSGIGESYTKTIELQNLFDILESESNNRELKESVEILKDKRNRLEKTLKDLDDKILKNKKILLKINTIAKIIDESKLEKELKHV